MKDWKDNVYFVLVEPREPGNIGSSARAMKNMGFRNLCLVRPPEVITDEARWLARNALDVLESAEKFDTVTDAVRDKSLVVGTTRRVGKHRGLILTVEEGAGRMLDTAHDNKVAVLFGRETRGLFNEEVAECGFLVTIPSSKMQPSLNLAHAVLVTAYELSKGAYKKNAPEGRRQKKQKMVLVDHENITLLYERMAEILGLLEYIPRGDRDLEKKIMSNLRHFIGRAGITDWELNMLHGICTQIEKKVKK